jgi:hypothetical protein
MSIASDPLYRSVAVSFLNNEQDGSELVQLLAKPAGGSWSAQRTFPVSGGVDQEITWDTALPVTAYSTALRYLQGSVPAVGYESSDPDAWTAATAPDSKGTVTTTSAAATGLAGTAFTSSSTPIVLTWACAQQAVPFLLEKSTNGGGAWSTVIADLVATTYPYPIPAGELGNTTMFRVTPKRGSVAGPTSASISVLMSIVVGATAFTTATFSPTTRIASLAWSAATQAVNYLLEKSLDAGANYSTIGTIAGLTYEYPVPDAEINTTVRFRVRGQSGATQGASVTTNLAMTLVVGASVLSLSVAFDPVTGTASFSWTVASNATSYSVQMNSGAGYVTIASVSVLELQVTGASWFAAVNTTVNLRVIGVNGAITGAASNVVSVALTTAIPNAPSGVTATLPNNTVSWSASTGNVSRYYVFARVGAGAYGNIAVVLPSVLSVSRPDLPAQTDAYVVSRTFGDYVIGGTSAVVPFT